MEATRDSVVDLEDNIVGDCWLDTEIEADPHHCVIVGTTGRSGTQIHRELICWVLFVVERHENDRFERIGVGKIPARYISQNYRSGKLV